MPSVLRSAAVFAAIFAVAVASMPGCSQQSEGERCDLAKNGDDDCDSGLVCVDRHTLLDQVTDRCCLPNKAVNDKRCTPAGVTGTGGTNGGGESDSDAGGGGATSADGETPADTAGGAAGAPSPTGGTGSDSAGMSSTPGGGAAAAGAPSGAGAGGVGG
jgi:hypothetical protein